MLLSGTQLYRTLSLLFSSETTAATRWTTLSWATLLDTTTNREAGGSWSQVDGHLTSTQIQRVHFLIWKSVDYETGSRHWSDCRSLLLNMGSIIYLRASITNKNRKSLKQQFYLKLQISQVPHSHISSRRTLIFIGCMISSLTKCWKNIYKNERYVPLLFWNYFVV
jgi:hypothetical protein